MTCQISQIVSGNRQPGRQISAKDKILTFVEFAGIGIRIDRNHVGPFRYLSEPGFIKPDDKIHKMPNRLKSLHVDRFDRIHKP